MKCRIIMGIALILLSCAHAISAQCVEKSEFPQLCTIQRIYIEELGNTDEAARFKFILAESLEDEGFRIVERKEDADAVLSGIVVAEDFMSVYKGTGRTKIVARGNMLLKSAQGERIWKMEFKPGFFKRTDGVKSMAKKVAEQLGDDWRKSSGKKK